MIPSEEGAHEGGRTLRKDVFLPSQHLLSVFYKTLPAKSPSKIFGGALKPYILNQDISKWHFSAHSAV